MDDPERLPVIIGVGQINDRPDEPDHGLDSLGLMEAALRLADRDAGGGWLADVESLAVVDQISFRGINPVAGALADRIGATPRMVGQTAMASGDSPILLLDEAANRIGSGEIRIAAVAGGEALRTAAQRAAAAGRPGGGPFEEGAARRPGYRQRFGLSLPVDVYPLYENAGRAAYGQNLAEGQRESASIWSLFSDVAADNPAAWVRRRVTSEEIATPGPDNRPIAHPYLKLMVANASVNQGAAFLVTSVAEAGRRGLPAERMVFVGNGAAAHEDEEPLARDRYDVSAGMEASILEAMALNGLTVADLDFVELYSCFPCVPKMARRVLGWPIERPASVSGGLTFGGGPIGNYMSHAVAAMVDRLRRDGGTGLLFANGGYATHNHTIAISSRPIEAARFPRPFDVQSLADARRGPVPPLLEDYAGPATIETHTVLYDRAGSVRHGVVVARTPDGGRTLATVPAEDEGTIAFLTDGSSEPVGAGGVIEVGTECGRRWRRDGA